MPVFPSMDSSGSGSRLPRSSSGACRLVCSGFVGMSMSGRLRLNSGFGSSSSDGTSFRVDTAVVNNRKAATSMVTSNAVCLCRSIMCLTCLTVKRVLDYRYMWRVFSPLLFSLSLCVVGIRVTVKLGD